jgi:hypothetical protein
MAVNRKLPKFEREFELEIQANRANIIIQESDRYNGCGLKISEMPLWEDVVVGMNKYANLGLLYMLVDEDGKVCIVPSHFIMGKYKLSRSTYFQVIPNRKIAILKKPYRKEWWLLVEDDYLKGIILFERR